MKHIITHTYLLDLGFTESPCIICVQYIGGVKYTGGIP